jgi:hypothetical protein
LGPTFLAPEENLETWDTIVPGLTWFGHAPEKILRINNRTPNF